MRPQWFIAFTLVLGCAAPATSLPEFLPSEGQVTPALNILETDRGVALSWVVNIPITVAPVAEATWSTNIDIAMLAWNMAIDRDVFVKTSTCTGTPCVLIAVSGTPKGTAALTTCGYNAINGHVTYCLVEINPGVEYLDGYRVITHELGHVLGLGHDPEQPNSVMYPEIHLDPWRITPEDVDYVYGLYH